MKKGKGKTPKNLIEVARLREKGWSYEDIALKYNVRFQTVKNWITILKKNKIGVLSTRDKTKIKNVLQLLYIDIEDKKSISDKCNEIMITIAQGGVKPIEAKLMAQGVGWFIEELIGKIK